MSNLKCLYGEDTSKDMCIALCCAFFMFIVFNALIPRAHSHIEKEQFKASITPYLDDRNVYWVRRLQTFNKRGKPTGTYWDYVILN